MFLLLAASAQEVLFRQVFDTKTDTHVEATALFSSPSIGGYMPVRILIANRQQIPHKIYLNFKDSTNYSESLNTSSSFGFSAPPGKTVVTDILVPLSAQNGVANYHTLDIALSGSMGKTQNSLSTVFTTDQPCVLLSESLYTPNGSALDTEISTRTTSSSYGRSGTGFSAKFDPKQLPDDWRAYSGYDTIMLTQADWADVPPGPRNAIISWVRLGGQLVLYTTAKPTLAALGLPQDSSFGKIWIEKIKADLRLNPKVTVNLATTRRGTQTRIESIINDFESAWPIEDEFGEKSFNYVLFVIILIAFGVLVGPVNLFVFAKSGRRHRLFITTPIISIATSLILVGLIILQDGFGGNGTRIVLMEVRPDENQNAAFIHQEQFSRSGVMTSPSFTVDAPALIAPVPIATSRWARLTTNYDSSGTYDLQPTDGKLFASGDWFQSRSEQGQLITAVIPTRGRIEAGSAPDTLISTFEFPIETLLYKDASGEWFRAENVTKGQRIKLTATDPTIIQPILNGLNARFSTRNRSYLKKVSDRDDHFIAITDQAPAIETHPGIDWKTSTIITGPIAR
ncbi:MAG: hypothetical protein NWT08_14050 [Akkermansiaceae bacterium]|jgi:hypothetical protein|nr:hypothetical protein [Akkermansiaceae bacterium]MDP4647144.1 hypothetical protein [Akkermansiaceae bacterium]MDP4722614.1 hypothetical protein [Akkermansiaceae bacterium]MDP4780438.1 hypothetical protein [Akkermansiaceae bacterium]MDP4847755.1 hypothetical protein [Akkermansiaceae bacterium]